MRALPVVRVQLKSAESATNLISMFEVIYMEITNVPTRETKYGW